MTKKVVLVKDVEEGNVLLVLELNSTFKERLKNLLQELEGEEIEEFPEFDFDIEDFENEFNDDSLVQVWIPVKYSGYDSDVVYELETMNVE